jgi:hypothetical protein
MSSRLTKIIGNLIVLMVSVGVGLLLCEVGARLVLNPGDYLSVTTVRDPTLGITIAPGSPGFDEWGFRNVKVPAAADVVAIGDSHTFGNTAALDEAWPSVVNRATGLGVYNFGMGGYGPNQYYHLLTTRGLNLHPKWVLCGLYFGDDFENAFSITYGLDHWASLRKGQWGPVEANIWDQGEEKPGLQKNVRNWLSRRSMVYRLLVHGPMLAKVKENLQFKRAAAADDPLLTSLDVPEKNIKEAFRPVGIAARLDQSNPSVVEGMRVTFELLGRMADACRDKDCKFAVVIIPTKETVFSDYLEGQSRLRLQDALGKVIANERVARKKVFEFLDGRGIAYVDTLPALQKASGQQLYARTTQDMHPGKNGYRVIGETVAAFLQKARQKP